MPQTIPKMGTPAHVFVAYMRSLIMVASCTMGVGIFVSRVYIFYEVSCFPQIISTTIVCDFPRLEEV